MMIRNAFGLVLPLALTAQLAGYAALVVHAANEKQGAQHYELSKGQERNDPGVRGNGTNRSRYSSHGFGGNPHGFG